MNRAQWAARKGRSSGWCKRTKRLALYLRDDFGCLYCSRDLRTAEPCELHLDHLDPKTNGGWHAPTNLVLACRACNSARQDRPWRRFVREHFEHRGEVEVRGIIERVTRHRRRQLNTRLARSIIRGEAPNPREEAGA